MGISGTAGKNGDQVSSGVVELWFYLLVDRKDITLVIKTSSIVHELHVCHVYFNRVP